MKKQPKIHVIIPHFGSSEMLDECVRAVHAQNYPANKLEVHIIDNNENNKLFTNAVNIALPKVRPQDVAWILNNDCVARPDAAAEAIKCMLEVDRCGVVGSCNLMYDDPDFIFCGGCLGYLPSGRHEQGRVRFNELRERTQQEWYTFSSVFVRGSCLADVGLLDPDLWFVCSDVDFCLRAAEANWHVWYEPKSEVLHKIGQSASTKSNRLKEVMAHDNMLFQAKQVRKYRKIHGYPPSPRPDTWPKAAPSTTLGERTRDLLTEEACLT